MAQIITPLNVCNSRQQLHFSSNCNTGRIYRMSSETTVHIEPEVFSVVPNPNQGRFKLQYNLNSEINAIEIWDNLGQLVYYHSNLQDGEELALDKLQQGVYIIKAFRGNIFVASNRVVISK